MTTSVAPQIILRTTCGESCKAVNRRAKAAVEQIPDKMRDFEASLATNSEQVDVIYCDQFV